MIVQTLKSGVPLTNRNAIFHAAIEDHLRIVRQLVQQEKPLELLAARIIDCVLSGGKVFWCGNGGSAADCQHLAAEFVGRFRRERQGLASIALTTDTSVLTSIGNDYGFNEIFRRQIQALCTPRDVVVGISTSGNSQNVCAALNEARAIGAFTACFTGIDGGKIAATVDVVLRVASADTARVQEAHILAGHILCDWVELAVCSVEGNGREVKSE
jgi:D-sedoheptulose 7-phosphate isomerase